MTLLIDNPFGNFFDDAFHLASWQLLVYISSMLAFNEAFLGTNFYFRVLLSAYKKGCLVLLFISNHHFLIS